MDNLTPEQFEHAKRVVFATMERYEKLAAAGLDPQDYTIQEQKAIVALLITHPKLLRKSERFYANGGNSLALQSEQVEARVECRTEGIEAVLEGPQGHSTLLWDAEHEAWVVQ